MELKQMIGNFKLMAEKAVSTLQEEADEFKHRWAPESHVATSRFEELKMKFSAALLRIEEAAREGYAQLPGEGEKIQRAIDQLRVQLALGKAETMEAFEEQKKSILQHWKVLKSQLEKQPAYEELSRLVDEWRADLEVLKVQYALGKMEWKKNWKNISAELGKEMDNLGKAVEAGAGIAGEKLDQVEEEIQRIIKKYSK